MNEQPFTLGTKLNGCSFCQILFLFFLVKQIVSFKIENIQTAKVELILSKNILHNKKSQLQTLELGFFCYLPYSISIISTHYIQDN